MATKQYSSGNSTCSDYSISAIKGFSPFTLKFRASWKCPVLIFCLIAGAVGCSSEQGNDLGASSSVESLDASVPVSEQEMSSSSVAGGSSVVPETEAPTTQPPAKPGIGDSITIEGGSIVRINSVTTNADPRSEYFKPDPGFAYTRVEVEVCSGSEGYNANALYWVAFLDDNTSIDPDLMSLDFETFKMAPGGCTKGSIDFSVPQGRTVTSIITTGALLDELGRWDMKTTNPVFEPLEPRVDVDADSMGQTVTFGKGHTAVVRSVTSHSPGPNSYSQPDEGRQFVNVDVELCAGRESLPVNPLYWLSTATDHYTGSADLTANTLNSLEIAAGQCVAGVVAIDLPDSATPGFIILVDPALDEIARWRVV